MTCILTIKNTIIVTEKSVYNFLKIISKILVLQLLTTKIINNDKNFVNDALISF